MKKILSLVLALLVLVGCTVAFASCGNDEFKIGVICLHDEKSTYDKNFIDAVNAAAETLGLTESQVILKTGIPETQACYDAAADLVDQGCKLVFADSFGHEAFMIKAAKQFPKVMFCHATGTQAESENLPNFFNAFASIYEGRYLAGVAAGMKLNELKEAGKLKGDAPKIGYVGAFTYAEVISGYTSFFLGARSVCPDVTMEVTFTGSWFDPTLESSAAKKLIENNCDLISQHADSMGAPSACEAAKPTPIPNVSYNVSTETDCANSFLIASKINWAPYFELIIKAVRDNDGTIPHNYTGTLSTNSVQVTSFNSKVAAAGTEAKLTEVKNALMAGTTHVFNLDSFTVGGNKLTVEYLKSLASFKNLSDDVLNSLLAGGYFHESDYRSAPYFEFEIDGITLLDRNYGKKD